MCGGVCDPLEITFKRLVSKEPNQFPKNRTCQFMKFKLRFPYIIFRILLTPQIGFEPKPNFNHIRKVLYYFEYNPTSENSTTTVVARGAIECSNKIMKHKKRSSAF